MVAWRPCIKLFFDAQYGQRQTATDSFRHNDDVWLDTCVFKCEQLTGACETSLDFVDDQQNAMVLRNFTDALQPLGRSWVHTALALHRFEDHRRWLAYAAFHVVDQVIEVVRQRFYACVATDTQRAAVLIRIRHKLHFRHHVADRFFW
ncbi:hypothetical protein D3C75_1054060 [compost metagenome]